VTARSTGRARYPGATRSAAPLSTSASTALHTTPGISAHLHPVTALTAEGVMMDLAALGYDEFTDAQREAVAMAYPRPPQFHRRDFCSLMRSSRWAA